MARRLRRFSHLLLTLPSLDFNPAVDSAYGLMEERVPEPRWAIEGWWVENAMGIIGGTPKTRKSTFALELAVTFATGSRFLNLFELNPEVPRVPVLVIQEENTRARVRSELESVFIGRELLHWEPIDRRQPELGDRAVWMKGIRDFEPLDVVSGGGFDLTSRSSTSWLDDLIERTGYRYVIMDPLYMVGGGLDINSAAEIVPVLRSLTRLKEETGCAVILVHHMSGKAADDPRMMGARLMGTTYLHGWYECGVFPTRTEANNPHGLTVYTEFRDKPSPEPFLLEAVRDTPGKWRDLGALAAAVLGTATEGSAEDGKKVAVAEWLRAHPGDIHDDSSLMLLTGEKTVEKARAFVKGLQEEGLLLNLKG